MQVNRERLLELAIQGGATIDNAQRVASDWEKWIDEYADPLRLDVPSPKAEIDWSRPHLVMDTETELVVKVNKDVNANMFLGELYPKIAGVNGGEKVFFKRPCVYYGEIEPKNPGNQEQEIDWSRPQLVEFTHFEGDKTILETNGIHSNEIFEGRRIGEVHINRYSKGGFKYHGEIPQEQQEALKTTGLNFVEALNIITDDKALGMQRTPVSAIFVVRDGRVLPLYTNRVGRYIEIFLDHLLATDWKIVTA